MALIDVELRASSVRVSAGVNSANVGRRSTASCTTPLLNTTRPTSLASTRTTGFTPPVAKRGDEIPADV